MASYQFISSLALHDRRVYW